MTDIVFRQARPDDEAAIQEIVFSVLAEYDLLPDPGSTDADIRDIQASYLARGGTFRVAVDTSGRLVGCGGLYPLSDHEGEIRKMYLVPAVRGQGLGRALLGDLVGFAKTRGYRRLVLETASVLKEAIGLYRSFGFVETPREHISCRCDQGFSLDLIGNE